MLTSVLTRHWVNQHARNLIASVVYISALFFYSIGISNAALIASGDVVIDDNGTTTITDDLFFYRDLSRFSDMTYAQQLASIDLLNSELDGAGPWNNDWHLATTGEMTNLLNDPLGVTGAFLPSSGSDYFAGRYEQAVMKDVPEHMWYEVILTGGSPPIYSEQDSIPDTSLYDGAWAVASYRVDEPSILLLMALGLAGIGYIVWKEKRT